MRIVGGGAFGIYAALGALLAAGCHGGSGSPKAQPCTGASCVAITLSSISVAPSTATIPAGIQQPFTATATFSDGTVEDVSTAVTWSTSDVAVASFVASGVVKGNQAGSVTVTATFQDISGAAQLGVTPAAAVSLTIDPTTASLSMGMTAACSAYATFSDGSKHDVTASAAWSSSDTSVATVSGGTISAVGKGAAVVSASFSGVGASAPVSVTDAVLQSIAVYPGASSFATGTATMLVAVGSYSDQSTRTLTADVVWASDDAAVSISTSGGQTTASGQQLGSAHVTATFSGITSPPVTLVVTSATLVSLAVTPSTVSMPAGLTQQLAATGTFSDGTTQDLTVQAAWSSSGAQVAAVSNAPGSAGQVTAVQAGSAVVTATIFTTSGTCDVSVTQAVLQALAVSPASASVTPGSALQLSATATYSDGTTRDLTAAAVWSSSDAAIATVLGGTARGVAKGQATISAALGGFTASAQLAVVDPVLRSLTLSPSSATLALGSVVQLALIGTYSDATARDLTSSATWSSTDPAVAAVGVGGVTGVAGGTATISASFGGLTAYAPVAVTAAALVQIDVEPQLPVLPTLFDQAFTAIGIYSDGSKQDLTAQATWATGDRTVATVSAAGVVHPAVAGATSVSASSGGVTGSTTLTVSTATLQAIEVDPPTASIAKGTATSVAAIGTYSDGSTLDLTSHATWSSSDDAVVGVIATAGALSAEGRAVGAATVTASFAGVSGAASITVTPSPLASIAIDPLSISIADGSSQQLALTGVLQDGTAQVLTSDPEVIWTSSDPQVAAVSRGLVTTVAPGTATVTATLLGFSATCDVTVRPAAIVGVAISPASASVPAGYQLRFTATGTYSDGTTQDVSALATWTSSSTGVAVVSSSTSGGTPGLATAIASGSTTITASYGGASASAALTVTAPTLQSIAVTPNPFTVLRGGKQQLTATGTFSDGSTVDVTQQCTWSSSSRSVAWVSKSGVVTGTKAGSVTITAKKANKKGSATGTVQ